MKSVRKLAATRSQRRPYEVHAGARMKIAHAIAHAAAAAPIAMFSVLIEAMSQVCGDPAAALALLRMNPTTKAIAAQPANTASPSPKPPITSER